MMEHGLTHELEGLWDKENIVFFSFQRQVDFKHSTISVETYFDDNKQTKKVTNAAKWVTERNQVNTCVMRFPIPRGAHNALVILTSESGEDELEKVLVFAEDMVPAELKKKKD